MKTVVESTCKISFEFSSHSELEELYLVLNSAAVALIEKRDSISNEDEDTCHRRKYLSDVCDRFNEFSLLFNPQK